MSAALFAITLVALFGGAAYASVAMDRLVANMPADFKKAWRAGGWN